MQHVLLPQKEFENYRIAHCLRVRDAGYILSALTFLRGFWSLFLLFAEWYWGTLTWLSGTTEDSQFNPFSGIGYALVVATALADACFGAAGGYGVYMRLPKFTAALGFWRLLCLMLSAPFFVVMIWYESSGWWMFLAVVTALLLLALEIYLLWVLCVVTDFCASEEQVAALKRKEDAEKKRNMNVRAVFRGTNIRADVPRMFHCLPLEEVIAVYAAVAMIICVYNLLRLWILSKATGWVLWPLLPALPETYTLEVILSLAGLAFAVVAMWSIVVQRRARNEERIESRTPPLDPQKRAEDRQKRRDTASRGMLSFFIFNLARLACYVPITAVSLVFANVCRAYNHGIANITLDLPAFSNASPMRCSLGDLFILLDVFLVILLDVYLLWGTFSLYHLYTTGQTVCSPFDLPALDELQAETRKLREGENARTSSEEGQSGEPQTKNYGAPHMYVPMVGGGK